MCPRSATNGPLSNSRDMAFTTDSNALRRQARSLNFAKESARQDRRSWQQKVLYHHRARTALSNERTYTGWLRLGVALVTLGFVVERLDLFLARSQVGSTPPVTGVLAWAPLAIYGLGSGTLIIATGEFFMNQARIRSEAPLRRRVIVGLVLMTFATLLLIALLLGLPAPHGLPQ